MAGLESFIAALLWVVPFALGRHLQMGASRSRRSWLSAAAGIAIAYVFVDLLPHMSRMQELFSTSSAGQLLPFPHYRVYISALVGFIIFYGLENMVAFSRPARQEKGKVNSAPSSWLHILGFAVYCSLMGYLLYDEASSGTVSLLLYSLAMFFHFWVVDHSLCREHGSLYDQSGRWFLASGVLAGWILGMLGFYSEVLVPSLMGFIGGGVVINSIKEELPEKGEGRVVPFILGAFGYALLLLLTE